jgi:hypothetical protein
MPRVTRIGAWRTRGGGPGAGGSLIRDRCQHARSVPAVLSNQGKSPGSGPERWSYRRTGCIPGLAGRTRREGRSAVAAGAVRAARPGAARYRQPDSRRRPQARSRAGKAAAGMTHVGGVTAQTSSSRGVPARDRPGQRIPGETGQSRTRRRCAPHRGRGLTRFTSRGVNRPVARGRSSGIVIHADRLAPGINADGQVIRRREERAAP